MIARYDLAPSGYFAAQATQIGATDEEIAAAAKNEVPQERIRAIAGRLQFAMITLHGLPPAGTA